MPAKKNTKKTNTPLKKSAMKKIHGGAGDALSKGGTTMPPVLVGKALSEASGSEVNPTGISGMSNA